MLVMSVFHPVYLGISLLTGMLYNAKLKGVKPALSMLLWQAPMIALIAAVNPLFSASGSTELFKIGSLAIYAESLAYGACMGMLLASVFYWFSNAAQVLSIDKIMALLGNTLPTVTLMVSMAARLVPELVRRGRTISNAQLACTSANSANLNKTESVRKKTFKQNLRLTNVLMGWSMEDSLETADAMKLCGWSASKKRTTYARYTLRSRDVIALLFIAVFLSANIIFAMAAMKGFGFYPLIHGLSFRPGFMLYSLFLLMPLALEVYFDLRWRKDGVSE